MDTMHLALMRARDIAGGTIPFARAIGRTKQNMYSLFNRERPCPAELVLKVEAVTKVSRHDLRPDLYPDAQQ